MQQALQEPSTLSQILAVVTTVFTIAIPVFGTYMIAKLNGVRAAQTTLVEKQAVMEKQQDTIHTLVNDQASRQRDMIATLRGTLAAKDNIPGIYERVVEVERLLHEQNVTTALATPAVTGPHSAAADALTVEIVGRDETLPVKSVEPPKE